LTLTVAYITTIIHKEVERTVDTERHSFLIMHSMGLMHGTQRWCHVS